MKGIYKITLTPAKTSIADTIFTLNKKLIS